MLIRDERKLVTVEVTPKEMDKINEIDFAVQTEFSTQVDLETYHEYCELEYTVLETALDQLKDNGVEADVLQFFVAN